MARLPYASALLLVASLAMAAPADAQWRGVDGGSRGMAPLSTARATSASVTVSDMANEMHATDGASTSTTRATTATATPASTAAATATTTGRMYRESFERGYRDGYTAWSRNGWRPGWQDGSRISELRHAAPSWGISGSSATAAPVVRQLQRIRSLELSSLRARVPGRVRQGTR